MRCSRASRRPTRARPRPQPAFLAHDDGWTRRCRSAPRSRDAWPRTPRAKPGWWRYCRGKRAAYRTHVLFYGICVFLRSIRRDVACYVLPGSNSDVVRETLQATSLPLVDGHVVAGIFRAKVLRTWAGQAIVVEVLDTMGGP